MPEVAGGQDGGDRLQIFYQDAQGDSPRCWISTTTKVRLPFVSLSSGLAGACSTHSAVNIRGEFEKCKPRGTNVLTTFDFDASPSAVKRWPGFSIGSHRATLVARSNAHAMKRFTGSLTPNSGAL
jgi:hypothetical protein